MVGVVLAALFGPFDAPSILFLTFLLKSCVLDSPEVFGIELDITSNFMEKVRYGDIARPCSV
jgi:hypothetical protein